MVQAAGVELEINVESIQLADSANATIAANPVISKSTPRPLYED